MGVVRRRRSLSDPHNGGLQVFTRVNSHLTARLTKSQLIESDTRHLTTARGGRHDLVCRSMLANLDPTNFISRISAKPNHPPKGNHMKKPRPKFTAAYIAAITPIVLAVVQLVTEIVKRLFQ